MAHGGRLSRRKGNRTERAIVCLLQDRGVAGERVPLSGAARGRGDADAVELINELHRRRRLMESGVRRSTARGNNPLTLRAQLRAYGRETDHASSGRHAAAAVDGPRAYPGWVSDVPGDAGHDDQPWRWPPYQLYGRIPLYTWGPGLAWARARLSAPHGKAYQRATLVLRQHCQANAMPHTREEEKWLHSARASRIARTLRRPGGT